MNKRGSDRFLSLHMVYNWLCTHTHVRMHIIFNTISCIFLLWFLFSCCFRSPFLSLSVYPILSWTLELHFASAFICCTCTSCDALMIFFSPASHTQTHTHLPLFNFFSSFCFRMWLLLLFFNATRIWLRRGETIIIVNTQVPTVLVNTFDHIVAYYILPI